MKVRILQSSTAVTDQKHYALSMLVGDSLCIDAGCLGFLAEPDEQRRVRDLLLTHAHLDHVASLPIFLENVWQRTPDCVTVHASQSVHRTLQEDLFNDRLWPDFIGLSTPEAPFLERRELKPGVSVQLDGLIITPVAVHHGVDSLGFIIDDGEAALAFTGDTAPTDAIWEVANATPNLRAVFLECSFPDSLADLAAVSDHLTPRLFAAELEKLQRRARIVPIALKARYRNETRRELEDLGIEGLSFAPIGEEFEI